MSAFDKQTNISPSLKGPHCKNIDGTFFNAFYHSQHLQMFIYFGHKDIHKWNNIQKKKSIADILSNVSRGRAQNSLNVESKCYHSYGLQSLKMKSILFKFNLLQFLYPFWKNSNYFPNTLIIGTMSAQKKTYCIQDIKEKSCLKKPRCSKWMLFV